MSNLHQKGPPSRHAASRGAPRGSAPPPFSNTPAVRVLNFRKIHEACGAEALALKLGMPLGRISEMLEGVNFGPELAYHLEVALGLAFGFMDRHGATLLPEDITRIKAAPLDDLPEEVHVPAAPSLSANPPPPSATVLPTSLSEQEPPMPKPTTPATAPSSAQDVNVEPAEAAARDVRRINFELLTKPKGVKTRLVELTGLSPANISHRLHGHKIFDAETGEFFCQKLGLPSGWFEVLRSEADIPPEVHQLLASAGGAVAPRVTQPRSTSKTALPKPAGTPLAQTRAQKAAKSAPAGTPGTLSLSAGVPVRHQVTVSQAPAPPTTRRPATPPTTLHLPASAAAPIAATAPAAKAPAVKPAAPSAQKPAAIEASPAGALAAQTAATQALSLMQYPAVRGLDSAGPMGLAFLLVLQQRMAAGRLPEDKAAALLQEVLAL